MKINLSKVNNFDLIRLFASLQVLLLHANAHLHIRYESLGTFFLTIIRFFPGVPVFFTISCFLIMWSYERNRDTLYKFYRNRLLRIFPALWVCLIITIGILLAFRIIQPLDLVRKDIVIWIATQSSFFQFYTPDILRPYGVGNPNGSLWTISLEIQFYLLVPLLYVLIVKGENMKRYMINSILLITASVLLYAYAKTLPEELLISKLLAVFLLPYLYNFVFGIMLYKNWNSIQRFLVNKGWYWLCGYLLYSFLFVTIFQLYSPDYWPNAFGFIGNLLLACTVISLAFTYTGLSERILRGNDFSYGLYIYHMVVINIFVELALIGQMNYLIAVVIITFLLAVLSWICIEKPALRYKKN